MDNMADEVIATVRESSREAILDKFNYVDDLVIDPNGEPVDWLVGHIAEPYLVTKFHSDGRERLREALVSNSIEPKKLLELE